MPRFEFEGVPLVNGAGQYGSVIHVDGFVPGGAIGPGCSVAFMSYPDAFYRVAERSIADRSGCMILKLRSPVREAHPTVNNEMVIVRFSHD